MRKTMPLLLFAGCLLLLPGSLSAQSANGFKVVVNTANPESLINKGRLSAFFLKRATRWGNGERVQAIELDPRSDVRVAFSQNVHGKDVAWVQSFWNKMIFSGRSSPPPIAETEEEVLAFVRANSNAIGYVAARTPLGDGLKVLEVEQ